MKKQIYLDFSEMQPTFETKSQRYEKSRATKRQPDFLPPKVRTPAITIWFYGKVNPVVAQLAALYNQLVEILMCDV